MIFVFYTSITPRPIIVMKSVTTFNELGGGLVVGELFPMKSSKNDTCKYGNVFVDFLRGKTGHVESCDSTGSYSLFHLKSRN